MTQSQSAKGTGSKRVKNGQTGIRQIGAKRWEVRVHAGRDPLTGKLRQFSRTVNGGIRAATAMRATMTAEVAADNARAAMACERDPAAEQSFGRLLDEWLAFGKSRGRSPSTLDGYRRKIDATIRPRLGSVRVAELSARMIDAFYSQLIEEGVSPATVKHYHRIISASLTQARKWGAVAVNVAMDSTPPSVQSKVFTVPSPDQVRSLIELAADSRSPEWATVITVAALTGLRRGELCGLQWGDVDWTAGAITVSRSIWQTRDGWGVKDPKSHQVRRLVLGEQSMGVLAGRYSRVMANAKLAEISIPNDAFVFSPDVGGVAPLLPGAVTLAFGRLCKSMAESTGEPWPYRFHDLRHYTATELFRAGHHARTVADRLGHADPSVTLKVYTHDTQDQAMAAAESLEAGILPQLSAR
jgi:integrase